MPSTSMMMWWLKILHPHKIFLILFLNIKSNICMWSLCRSFWVVPKFVDWKSLFVFLFSFENLYFVKSMEYVWCFFHQSLFMRTLFYDSYHVREIVVLVLWLLSCKRDCGPWERWSWPFEGNPSFMYSIRVLCLVKNNSKQTLAN